MLARRWWGQQLLLLLLLITHLIFWSCFWFAHFLLLLLKPCSIGVYRGGYHRFFLWYFGAKYVFGVLLVAVLARKKPPPCKKLLNSVLNFTLGLIAAFAFLLPFPCNFFASCLLWTLSYIEKWERECVHQVFLPPLCLGNPLSSEGGKERWRLHFPWPKASAPILCPFYVRLAERIHQQQKPFPYAKSRFTKRRTGRQKGKGRKEWVEKRVKLNAWTNRIVKGNCFLISIALQMTVESVESGHTLHTVFGFYSSRFSVESSVQIPLLLLLFSWQIRGSLDHHHYSQEIPFPEKGKLTRFGLQLMNLVAVALFILFWTD